MLSTIATIVLLVVTAGVKSLPADNNNHNVSQTKKVNTTERLEKLREQLRKENLSAYIILSNDDHQSEYIGEHDKRREYISGFTGSAGDAVVTLNSAAMWTDSRYYLQAEEQMDSNWLLMKTGEKQTPSIEQWIIKQLHPNESISSDPRIATYKSWDQWNKTFASHNLTMKLIMENLVDRIWGEEENRPSYPNISIFILDTKYSGMTWQEKLKALREDMKVKGVDMLLLTELDEVAWTLNLRGGDIPFTPVFRSYLIITINESVLYVPKEKVTEQVIIHLNSNHPQTNDSVSVKEYTDIWKDLKLIGNSSTKIWLPSNFGQAKGVSFLIYNQLPSEKIEMWTSPALTRKAIKNEVEAAGMKKSHIRDAVALCQFLAQIEEEIEGGDRSWTELKVVEKLHELRSKQILSMGPSFYTIAAYGSNAALPHYEPSEETNKAIDGSQLLLIDSGGQYFDGTTDVTRTVHFGNPRDKEIEVYTRLLMGCIDIASVVFKSGYTTKQLEILIRAPLYQRGLDYGHGSTHGIGSFLSVHEAFNSTYEKQFFGSQEPGYYKENDFGMRLENIITVIETNYTNEDGSKFLTFEPVTMVPYEKKLINITLLEKKHIKWLNDYYHTIQTQVGEEMKNQGLLKEYEWLLKKTQNITV